METVVASLPMAAEDGVRRASGQPCLRVRGSARWIGSGSVLWPEEVAVQPGRSLRHPRRSLVTSGCREKGHEKMLDLGEFDRKMTQHTEGMIPDELRCRVVAMQKTIVARFDVFAGTSPLKLVRLALSLAASMRPGIEDKQWLLGLWT